MVQPALAGDSFIPTRREGQSPKFGGPFTRIRLGRFHAAGLSPLYTITSPFLAAACSSVVLRPYVVSLGVKLETCSWEGAGGKVQPMRKPCDSRRSCSPARDGGDNITFLTCSTALDIDTWLFLIFRPVYDGLTKVHPFPPHGLRKRNNDYSIDTTSHTMFSIDQHTSTHSSKSNNQVPRIRMGRIGVAVCLHAGTNNATPSFRTKPL